MKFDYRKHLVSFLDLVFVLGITCFSFGLLTTIFFVLYDYQSINAEKLLNALFVLCILLIVAFLAKYFKKKYTRYR